jgi:putative heme-binding domain-containing protein
MVVSLPDAGGIDRLVRSIAEPAEQAGRFAPWQFAGLAGILEARNRTPKLASLDVDGRFARVWDAARALASDDKADDADRLPAVRLLSYAAMRNASDRDRLVAILRPQVSVALQQAAVAALSRSDDPKIGEMLVRDWKAHSPQVRGAILDAVMSRANWTSSLLAALEDGCVPPAEIDPARRYSLLTRRNTAHRTRAQAIFAHQGKPRQSVVELYRPALGIRGDRAAGAAVFKKLCASCHRLANEGVDVGPDLATLTDRSPEALLVAILDPNRAFETKYTNFSVATTDGRVLSGLIASESATAVTLRRQDGKEDVLLRSQIEEMTASGQSLMPEGVEKDLKPRDLADLIAFLSWAAPERKTK